MARFIALVFASLLITVGGANASTTARSPHQAIAHRHGGWMDAHANPKHAWLYVSGNANNTVAIYDLEKTGVPEVGMIRDGVSSPGGMTVDDSGAVYVANQTGSVTIYAPGSTSPSLTLSQGLESPQGVSTDSAGNVYVCNRGNAPSITVYAPGQSLPSQVITDNLIQVPTQIAFDSAGDLYFSDNNTGVSEIPAGSSVPVSLGFQGLQRTDGLALDPLNGNLFVGNFGGQNGDAILVYPPGSTNPLRKLGNSDGADSNAFGMVRKEVYFFAPDSYTDEVRAFKNDHYRPTFTLNVSEAHYPVGVAVKRAGVP